MKKRLVVWPSEDIALSDCEKILWKVRLCRLMFIPTPWISHRHMSMFSFGDQPRQNSDLSIHHYCLLNKQAAEPQFTHTGSWSCLYTVIVIIVVYIFWSKYFCIIWEETVKLAAWLSSDIRCLYLCTVIVYSTVQILYNNFVFFQMALRKKITDYLEQEFWRFQEAAARHHQKVVGVADDRGQKSSP